jgi:hypothetical protein
MTTEIIDSVNKDVLKSFKTLQKNKTVLYTTATSEYLVTINDKSMLVYDNPKEIDFEGTFKLARNKLIPVDQDLDSDPAQAINLNHFTKLKDFNKNMVELQKFCYAEGLTVNISEINDTLDRLLDVYKSYTLYKNTEKAEVMFAFGNTKHKTFLLSKLI